MENKKKDKIISSVIGNAVSLGIGAAFLTEEYMRKYLSDLPVPKELVSGLLNNAKGIKKEFIDSVREDLREHFKSVDPRNIVESVLDNYDIELESKIKFKKKKP